ncbi:MAG TPA: MBL fold metallo-hydrolase [Anaerolineales bacterium]|nr:MBL fold metallo-hydrolase [Anaerolineae bacterium]HIQ01864.1 MBL fold metallo-hydrolase [Anaerolineales bacterium]
MEEIAPGVYVSSFYPGINVGLIVTDGGPIMVDSPPLPDDARAWRERAEEVAGGPIRYVVLTDHHPDRLIGAGWPGAPVVAGRGAFRRLREGGESLWRAVVEEWVRRRPGAEGLADARPVLPEVIVAGRVSLHGSVPVVVESVPGAAPGSVWVRLPEQEVLFAGDTVVVGAHPFLAEAPDTRAWLETLVDLRRPWFPARLIVPGRGPVCDKEATRDLSAYIQRVRRRIRSVHTAGGGRGDLAGLVEEFLSLFPIEEGERERVQRQVRAGLERVFEELRPEEAEE